MPMPSPIRDDVRPQLAGGVRFQIDPTSGNAVLLFPEGILELNETAHAILTHCDGKNVGEIVQALAEEYDIDLTSLANDVRETLSDLQQRKLIRLE